MIMIMIQTLKSWLQEDI